jgi:hypothetical protein
MNSYHQSWALCHATKADAYLAAPDTFAPPLPTTTPPATRKGGGGTNATIASASSSISVEDDIEPGTQSSRGSPKKSSSRARARTSPRKSTRAAGRGVNTNTLEAMGFGDGATGSDLDNNEEEEEEEEEEVVATRSSQRRKTNVSDNGSAASSASAKQGNASQGATKKNNSWSVPSQNTDADVDANQSTDSDSSTDLQVKVLIEQKRGRWSNWVVEMYGASLVFIRSLCFAPPCLSSRMIFLADRSFDNVSIR